MPTLADIDIPEPTVSAVTLPDAPLSRLDEIRARKEALGAEMQADEAQHRDRLASGFYRGAIPAPESAAGAPEAVPATQAAPGTETAPQRSAVAPWARNLMDYAGETVANIPESAERLATGIYEAATDPIGTAESLGKLAVGAGQAINEAVGLPESMRVPGGDLGFGDQRATAEAAVQGMAERYGGWEQLGTTFRDDPVGFAADLLSVAVPAAGAVGRTGQATGAVRKAAPSKPTAKELVRDAPSTEQLRAQGGALYEAAEKSGVRFPGAEYNKALDQISTKLMREGVDPVLHPKAHRIMQIMTETRGRNPSLMELDTLRRQFGDAAASTDRSEARLARIAMDDIDKFVESGSPSASGTIKEARALWARMRKSEIIETAIEDASLAKEGVEAGLRNRFTVLYRQRNKPQMRGFSKEELAAIKAVATGNFSANVLRRIGSLSGGTGAQRNMLNALVGSGAGAGVGAGIGGPLGGGIGAVAVPAAGHVAQRLAQRGTQRRADLARAMVASGQTPGRRSLPVPSAPRLQLPQASVPLLTYQAHRGSEAADRRLAEQLAQRGWMR